jgi:P27 family predicted phage terminase small subunit
MGLLTVVDFTAFKTYCQLYSNYVKAARKVEAEGLTYTTPNGIIKDHPAYRIMSDLYSKLVIYLREFGLTPSSRSKITVAQQEQDDSFGGLL